MSQSQFDKPENSPANSNDALEVISSIAPFEDLPGAVLTAIVDISTLRAYAPGENIYTLGQYDGSELFIVGEGQMKAALADSESGAVMIDIIPKGSIFGLAASVAGSHGFNCEELSLNAETTTTIIAIDAQAFRTIVAQRPSLTRNLMNYFAHNIAGASFASTVQEVSPECRIYAALMDYVERDAINANWRIDKMPKHRELAEKTDTDEALVASAVAQLIQDDIARRDYPGLIISDMEKLNRLAS